MLQIKKITLTPIITGVAPGAQYDPSIMLIYDDEECPTIKAAAITSLTVKLPVLVFEDEAVAV